MKRTTATLAVALGLPLAAQSPEVGFGVRLNNAYSGSAIYVPVKVNAGFLLEGALNYWHAKNESDSMPGFQNEWTTSSLGVGLFGLKALGDSVRAYLGPRISYGKSTAIWGGVSGQRTDSKGFTLTPTLGVEYFPTRHCSIGGEVGLAYGHATGQDSGGSGVSSTKNTEVATVSSVILRYYF